MAVITISRGSYSHGKEIAEKVAQRLGYDCISREILIEASREFNIPEIKLYEAIQEPANIMTRMFTGKDKYIAYIQSAVLKSLKKDNVVYHGFAGHFFVKDIPHVLKVRIVADMEDRVRIMMERNGASRKEAVRFIHKLDGQRNKWSQQLYGIDTSDPNLYDLVIHLDTITINDAVDIICKKVGLKRFQTTSYSQQKMEDLSLEADVKAQLVDFKPAVQVKAQKGAVKLLANESTVRKLKIQEERRSLKQIVPGIKELRVDILPTTSNPDNYLCLEVLIVDDESIVCERLKAFLEGDGHRIETCTDPVEAMRRLETKEYDIVISDIRMQEIDGIQIMEKVLQKSKHTKVIMITGYATLDLAREALTKGAFDFIAKPFKMKDIRKTIQRAAESIEQNEPAAVNAAGG